MRFVIPVPTAERSIIAIEEKFPEGQRLDVTIAKGNVALVAMPC